MSNEKPLKTFPSTRLEALAILYVEKNMTKDMSPSEFFDFYQSTFGEIYERATNSNK